MTIHITGRHIEITKGLRDYIEEKISHLSKLFERPLDVHVVLLEEHGEKIAEANLNTPHFPTIHAHGNSSDMYASIDIMVDRLKSQIQKDKEKSLDRRDHKIHGNQESFED